MATPDVVADLAPTGTLRASINLGNPVLAQGTPEQPTGITVDLARELARRLDVPLELLCFDAARKSFAAMAEGRADLCFLAIDPAREEEVAFSPAYVVIEGVYAVPGDSPLRTVADVDRPGHRIGVKQGSAYDLFLTRTLAHAEVVRGAEGLDVFREEGLEVGAGIREPVTAAVAADAGLRLIDEAFMQIRQAVGVRRDRRPASVDFLAAVVTDLLASGFVTDALRRAGQSEDLAGPQP